MKKLSIKARVTLWYTGLLLFLLALGLGYLLSFADQIFSRQLRDTLQDVVSDVVKVADFEHGELDDDHIDYYRDGVSIFLYDTNGRLLTPRVNRGIQVDSLLEDQVVKVVDNGQEKWMVHDLYAVQGETGFWVRGVISMSGTLETMRNMLLLALVGVPVFVLVAMGGGYWITKRAFSPVGKMAETAKAITSGNDLSLRISDDRSGDELSRLGHAMNVMLARLQASFENERQFTADVSHELRTPTAIIIAQCEYLLEQLGDEKEQEACVRSILKQGQKMHDIIAQLLLLVRAENGKFQPHWEQVNLSEICEMVVLEIQDFAQELGITLQMKLEPHIILVGDETLLMRLLTNLIHNALDYNKPGGSVTLQLSQREDGIHLSIADTGIGIPAKELDKIWNRFYRVESSRHTEGTGLGLSMVQWIVKEHGGTIEVQSVLGEGSMFVVTLPRYQQEK